MKYLPVGFLLGLLLWTSDTALAQTNSEVLRHKNQAPEHTYVPAAGYVATADVAKKIAEAVWVPIYGKKHIEEEKPFQAILSNDGVWVVQGSLPKGHDLGGTAYIEINKLDGRILKVTHGK